MRASRPTTGSSAAAYALATELADRASAVLETSARPTRAGVRSARQLYAQALAALDQAPPANTSPPEPRLRQLASQVARSLLRARLAAWWGALYAHRRAVAGATAIVLGALGTVPLLQLVHPDLLQGRPFRLSSEWAKCAPARESCGGGTTRVFFHTQEEQAPFIEYDLGRSVALRRVTVVNRRDSGLGDRAVPLLVETSVDGKSFQLRARRDYWFDTWDATFEPREARYLRLRVDRKSVLHLERVQAWE